MIDRMATTKVRIRYKRVAGLCTASEHCERKHGQLVLALRDKILENTNTINTYEKDASPRQSEIVRRHQNRNPTRPLGARFSSASVVLPA